jgi:hypothetical protein
VIDQIVRERFISTPIAENGAILFDDEPFYLRSLGFDILLVDSIVSNKGIGHGDDLTFVGRIGEDLLVAGHAGIKNNFSCLFTQKPERPSLEYSPIL